jgi:serine/threonine-protein kinase
MPSDLTDRNLLFGVLALQADLLDAAQFAEACTSWSARKDRALADLLVERGWLTPEDRGDVERLLERKLKKHAGDAHASLVAAVQEPARDILTRVEDPDVQHSVADFPAGGSRVMLSTVAYQPQSRERYTLTRVHAQGGIGQVWLAHDDDLGREVALKEVRPDKSSQEEVWARFVEEARITGQLEHPSIVPVYELARRSEDQRPFYTMRFVKGRTLREASKEYHRKRAAGRTGPLDLRELLGQFLGVCNAIAYAHDRGVLHRDLKGSNVIVGDFGEVIVLDWGLAKVRGKPDSKVPLVRLDPSWPHDQTVQGQVLGTPGYMSPEQAAGRTDLVDERSDVYGLGAMLYEILTGEPPFVGEDTQEVLRRVAVEQPWPPSAIVPATPHALEAVCLKALAKEPAGRYASASELATEVSHYLADEPVAAYPEPVATRLARWGRRHRPLVTGAAALLLALVVGLASGTVLLGRANARIERERAEAQRQRDRADANFQGARKAVDDYLTQVSENTLLKSPLPGLQPLRKELLRSALKYYDGFVAEHQDDQALRAELARAHARAGNIDVSLGSEAEGYASLRQAREILQELADQRPGRADLRAELADVYLTLGKASAHKPEETAEYLGYLRKAHDLAEQLVRDEAGDLGHRALLAKCSDALARWYTNNGQPVEELPHLERAAGQWAELAHRDPKYRPDAASATMNLGYYYTRVGDAVTALRYLGQARDQFEQLVKEQPTDVTLTDELRRAYTNIGYVNESLTGRHDLALLAYDKGRTILDQLTRDHPAVVKYQLQKGGNLNQIANQLVALGQPARAEPFLRMSEDVFERLRKQNPDDPTVLYDVGEVHCMRGKMYLGLNKPGDAVKELKQAGDWQDRAFRANPDDLDGRMGLVRTLRMLGLAQQSARDLPGAGQSLRRAVELSEQVDAATRRRSHLLVANLVVAYSILAGIEEASGHAAEAERAHQRMAQVWDQELKPIEPGGQTAGVVGEGYLRHGQFQIKSGEPAAARKTLREAERTLQPLARGPRAEHYQLACVRALLSALVGADDKAEGRRYADQAVGDLGQFLHAGGATTAALVEKEPALQALAGRDDFRALVAEREALEKAFKENAEHSQRAQKLALGGDHARAVAEVQPILESKYANYIDLYNAACVYSLSSAAVRKDAKVAAEEQTKLGRQYADRAMELLRQSVAKGYRGRADVNHMKSDTDLDPLRERADFKKLIDELEARLNAPAKKLAQPGS